MTIGYCIAAHSRPEQAKRLIRRILNDDPQGVVILHFDQRRAPASLDGIDLSRIHLIKERPVYWGGSEIVDLYRDMLRCALSINCSYAMLLSGQDYPLRKLEGLEDELARYDVWTDAKPAVDDNGDSTWPEGRRRYLYQWVRVTRSRSPKWLRGVDRLARGLRILSTSNSEWPGPRFVTASQMGQLWWGVRSKGPGVPLYWGSAWANLSRDAMIAVCSAPGSLMKYFSRVPIPDEACIQTILHNCEGLTFARDDGRYIRWGDSVDNMHPDILTVKDLDALVASGAHFARKFDDHIDALVLDRLDEVAA